MSAHHLCITPWHDMHTPVCCHGDIICSISNGCDEIMKCTQTDIRSYKCVCVHICKLMYAHIVYRCTYMRVYAYMHIYICTVCAYTWRNVWWSMTYGSKRLWREAAFMYLESSSPILAWGHVNLYEKEVGGIRLKPRRLRSRGRWNSTPFPLRGSWGLWHIVSNE